VNQDYWKKLPDEVKTALQEVAVEYRDHLANMAMDRAADSLKAYIAAGGNVVKVSDEERAAWAAAIPNVAQEWADNLNKKGEDGTKMLNTYLGKLKDAGYTGIRDWSVK
jgi:TRAP-type C4-dicarboxylate transport system substrate-binding protein